MQTIFNNEIEVVEWQFDFIIILTQDDSILSDSVPLNSNYYSKFFGDSHRILSILIALLDLLHSLDHSRLSRIFLLIENFLNLRKISNNRY